MCAGWAEVESSGSFPCGRVSVGSDDKTNQSPLQSWTMFFIKNTLISLNKILSRDESLLPAPRTLSRGTVSCQAHPPALWEDPAQTSEVLPVLMSHGLGVAGAGAWPGVVGGQPPCRGRKQCCWLYSQSSSGAQRILSSLQGLVFHSM